MAVGEVVTEAVDFDALEADASARLEELREQEQRLSLPALSDSEAASALRDVQSEVASCERVLGQVGLARAERSRLDLEAREAAAAAAREAAFVRARVLQAEREQVVRAIDGAARKLAHALADYARICVDQRRELSAGGRRGGAASSSSIERALARAFSEAGVPRGMVDLPPLGGPPLLLSELDPRHIEAVQR